MIFFVGVFYFRLPFSIIQPDCVIDMTPNEEYITAASTKRTVYNSLVFWKYAESNCSSLSGFPQSLISSSYCLIILSSEFHWCILWWGFFVKISHTQSNDLFPVSCLYSESHRGLWFQPIKFLRLPFFFGLTVQVLIYWYPTWLLPSMLWKPSIWEWNFTKCVFRWTSI